MSALSEELVRITEQGRSAVLATIVEAQGSDRVQAGAKCLVVDGKWTPDPRVTQTVPNPFGGVNSVFKVGNSG